MSKILFFIGCIVALILAFYCISMHKEDIQADIARRGTHAVRGDNLNDSMARTVGLHVDGRDIALSGYVPTQEIKDEMYNRASNVWGVRKVINNLQLTPPEPPPIEPVVEVEVEPLVIETPVVEAEIPNLLTPAPEPELVKQRIPTKTVVKAFRAPTKEAVVQSQACEKVLRDMLTEETILFSSGSDNIQSQSYGLLDRIAREAKKCPSSLILVEGHTDSSGDAAKNIILSKKRAGAVVDYLVSEGVDQPLKFVGYGANTPVANNNTAEGRALNRRIEFKVQAIKQ